MKYRPKIYSFYLRFFRYFNIVFYFNKRHFFYTFFSKNKFVLPFSCQNFKKKKLRIDEAVLWYEWKYALIVIFYIVQDLIIAPIGS